METHFHCAFPLSDINRVNSMNKKISFVLLTVSSVVLTILIAVFAAVGDLVPIAIVICFMLCGVMLASSVLAWVVYARRLSANQKKNEVES